MPAPESHGTAPVAVLDAGNSRLNVGLIDPGRHLPNLAPGDGDGLDALPAPDQLGVWNLPCATDAVAEAVAAEVTAAVAAAGIGRVVLVSVVPAWTARLRHGLPDIEVLDHTWRMPFAWGVDQPAQVGPDRIANVAMAAAWGLQEALVVDAGTATTFDLLTGGRFAGGLIAPGMGFAARKLGEAAARLDPVPLEPVPCRAGTNTRTAMAAGAWATGIHGIRGTIGELVAVHGPRPIIMTGGLGSLVEYPGAYGDPAWTLRGAAFLALYQH